MQDGVGGSEWNAENQKEEEEDPEEYESDY